MRFYDQHLKGETPAVADPPIAVQTNDGKWRAEQSWPPADSQAFTTAPRGGSYTDDGTANATGPLITRQGHLVRSSGPVKLDLWSADWKIPAGHRIGVKVADSNGDWWVHVPTKQTVTVSGGSIALPFLTTARTDTIQGDPGTQLAGYLADTVTVAPATIAAAETPGSATP